MSHLALVFLGDCVGGAGRRAVAKAVHHFRNQPEPVVLIANGENSRNGSGLSPDNYRELRRAGGPGRPGGALDAVTLGDHCFRDRTITPLLDDPSEPLCRPANLSPHAPGKRRVRIDNPATPGLAPVYVLTVLGRLFMPVPADSPFDAVDRELDSIPERDAIVIVEVHAEASSEKQAMAWHCLEKWSSPSRARVVAVLGTHTHVQTNDARILDLALACCTDVGMCGPHRSVIGRDIHATLEAMARQTPTPLDVASDDLRARGVLVRVDLASRSPASIELLDLPCSARDD